MFGVILFWLDYIVSGILLYHILRCIYVKKKDNSKYTTAYYKSDDDEKLKYPLWQILLFLLTFLIPIVNLFVYIIYLCVKLINDWGSEYNKYYCRSFFTKEY